MVVEELRVLGNTQEYCFGIQSPKTLGLRTLENQPSSGSVGSADLGESFSFEDGLFGESIM